MARSVLRESIVTFTIKFLAGASGYILFAMLSRFMGASAFGEFSVLFSLALLLGVVGGFGQQLFLVKNVLKARNIRERNVEKGVIVFSMWLTVLSSVLAAILFACVSTVFVSTQSHLTVYAGAGLVFLYGVTQTTVGVYRVYEQVAAALVTREVLWRVCAGVGAVITWHSFSADLDVGLAFVLMAAALVAPAIIHLRFTMKKLQSDLGGEVAGYQISRWLSVSSGFALIAFISSADFHMFTFALKGLVDAPSIAAFFAATKTVEIVNMFLIAVTLVASTGYASLIAVGDSVALQRSCNANLIIQNIPSIIFCVLVICFSNEIIAVFDPQYEKYGPILILLAIAMLINSLAGATGVLLQLGNMHWISVCAQGGALAAGLFALPWLVALYDVFGAGLALVLSKFSWNAIAIFYIRKRLGVDPSIVGLLASGSKGILLAIEDVAMQLKK